MPELDVKQSALSFPVTFEEVEEVITEDNRFTRVKCWLMHTGENYNQSSFSREVIEDALPTLSYIPLVGFIEDNALGEKDFSNHRYVITKDDGKLRRKYCGSAYGVILSNEDNNAHFETKLCDDGIEREFIVADGIMWNFLEDSSNIINRDMIKDHSIELDEDSIDGYEDENGIFHFSKFSFRAACIIGGDSQPAMEGSTVEVQFTMKDFVKDIQSELNDKYSAFTKLVNSTAFTNSVNKKNNQGGIGKMSKTNFAQTLLAQFQEICDTVRQFEAITDRWGDQFPRYSVVDVQEDEVIVVDAQDNYNYYGFTFAVNGDKAEIDFAKCKKKKVRYEDYSEGEVVPEGGFNFGKHISDVEKNAFTKVEVANEKLAEAEEKVFEFATKFSETEKKLADIEADYTQVKADYDELKPKYDEYVKKEQERINAELDAQKDAEFAKYETVLSDSTEFTALKEKKAELTMKEIESECAILYARKNLAQTNFSKDNNVVKAGIISHSNEDDGLVETKYGYIPVGR